jgi:hypothetical protein
MVTFLERLRAGAERNVRMRNALADGIVKFIGTGSGEFSVARVMTNDQVVAVVRFRREGSRIVAEGDKVDVRFEGTLTLNDDGDCRLLVNGQELDEWQVLRRALEQLFFTL